MELITFESETFKRLEFLMERAAQLPSKDKFMSLSEAAEYLGVDKRWVDTRKRKIGFFQDRTIIRIKKSDLDKYIEKLTIRSKEK